MKTAVFVFAIALGATVAGAALHSRTYVGVITDTMCVSDHKPMRVTPDARCVRECVGDARTYKYALADGKHLYKLSDQETPAQLAGAHVRITGVLYPKTNILKVEKIELAK